MQGNDNAGAREAPLGHDQLFKQLLRAFFAEFMHLFDPQTAARLDLDTVSFRDAEAFTDIPQGERRTADLVVQVHTVAGAPELVLIHMEIQREREARFPWRMWQYYALLRQREGLPVIPIALLLYAGREGIALEE
jgi:Putative transposase, YhgA-like